MTMIPVRVLRTVRVAETGNIYGREIVAGTDDIVPDDVHDDLLAAGYVALPEAKADDDAPPVIPSDWRDLHHMKLIVLAKHFDPAVTNKAEAVAALEKAVASSAQT